MTKRNWNNLSRRGLAMFLTLIMCLGMLPVSVFAEEGGHTHNADGWTCESSRTLRCEREEHKHSDACYETTSTLICEDEEADHEHSDACFEISKELTCEAEEHEHGDDCYEVVWQCVKAEKEDETPAEEESKEETKEPTQEEPEEETKEPTQEEPRNLLDTNALFGGANLLQTKANDFEWSSDDTDNPIRGLTIRFYKKGQLIKYDIPLTVTIYDTSGEIVGTFSYVIRNMPATNITVDCHPDESIYKVTEIRVPGVGTENLNEIHAITGNSRIEFDVTLTCAHAEYDEWTSDGADTHTRQCSACIHTETENHSFTEADCVTANTCEVCGATGAVDPDNHAEGCVLGETWQSDGENHWKVYSRCSARAEEAAHIWNDGVVTTEPTETEQGIKTFTCTVCGQTKTENIDPTGSGTTVPVESVTLDRETLDLTVDQKATLVATVTPENATNKAVKWTSSDETVATVDENGAVTAVAKGSATITVTTVAGDKTATCAVTVVEGECKHENTTAVANTDGATHKVTCSDCKAVIAESELHTYAVNGDNKGKCTVCGHEIAKPTVKFTVNGKVVETDSNQPTLNVELPSDGSPAWVGVQIDHPLLQTNQGSSSNYVKFDSFRWFDEKDNHVYGPRSKTDQKYFTYEDGGWGMSRATGYAAIPITSKDHARTGSDQYLVVIYGKYKSPDSSMFLNFYESGTNFIEFGSSTSTATDPTCYLIHVNVVEAQKPVAKIVRDGEDVTFETLQAAINDAKDGETVILLEDVTENVTVTQKTIMLDLGGKTVAGTESSQVAVLTISGGNVTLTGNGTITGGHATLFPNGGGVTVNHGGTFLMESGTITKNTAQHNGGGVFVYSGTFTMKSGTISDNNGGNYGGGVYIYNSLKNESAQFIMDGGVISGNRAASGGGVGCSAWKQDDGRLVARLNSGVITGNTVTGNGGGVAVESTIGTGDYKDKTGQHMLEIGRVSIVDNTANMGGGVYSYDAITNITGATITENKTAGSRRYGGGIMASGGELKLADVTITDNQANYGGGVYSCNKERATTVTMASGTITGNTATQCGGGFYQYSGTKGQYNGTSFTMTGGMIYGNKANSHSADVYSNYADLTLVPVSNWNVSLGDTPITGWYKDGNIRWDGAHAESVDKVTGLDGIQCLIAAYTPVGAYVARNVDTNVEYTTLQKAVNEAKDGETVTLLKSTAGAYLTTAKSITLNIPEGMTVTGTSYGFLVQGDGAHVTITGAGTIQGEKYGVVVQQSGNLTVDMAGGNVKATGDTGKGIYIPSSAKLTVFNGEISGYIGIYAAGYGTEVAVEGGKTVGTVHGMYLANGASATVTGGTVCREVENAKGYAIFLWGPGGETSDTPTTLTVTGGSIRNTQNAAISGNGSVETGNDARNTKITISGGEIVSTKSWGIYHPQQGEMTIAGGTITGITGIEMRAGTLNVSGSPVITGTSKTYSFKPNSNGATTTGAGIVLSQHVTERPITATISGGTITGYHALVEHDLENAPQSEGVGLSITNGLFVATGEDNVPVISDNRSDFTTGGTFSNDVSNDENHHYVADNYVSHPISNPSGYYNVHRYAPSGYSYDSTNHWNGCTGHDDCLYGPEETRAPHIWDGGVITVQPQVGVPGVRVYNCTVCDATRTETLPALMEDNIGGGADGRSPDGIPDIQEAVVYYSTSNEAYGTVAGAYQTFNLGSANASGTVTLGNTASTTTLSRTYFSSWTQNGTVLSTGTALDVELAVTAGSTYEVVANFGRTGTGGGGGGGGTTGGGGTGGGGGGGTTIVDNEVPLAGDTQLNRDDHFAYVSGYADGTVRPTNNITREEVAAIFYRLLTEESRAIYDTDVNDFSDVASDRWSNRAISTLTNAGILNGYPDGTFRPGQTITRAEFAAIAAQFDVVTEDVTNPFSDTTGHWAETLISFAAGKGWVSGYTDGTFLPQKAITRAEAMTLINNVLNRRVDAEGLLAEAKQWSDNPEGTWYYYEVLEATNSHDYDRRNEGELVENWTAITNE